MTHTLSRPASFRRFAGCLAAALLAATVRVGAQESLAEARDLYAAAAYDDALTVLNRLKVGERPAEESRSIELYRAFCLLALGRTTDAERAIETVVASQPAYRPADSDISPRVRATFVDVRRRVLPAIAQQRYARAKASYDQQQYAAAIDGFKETLDLLAETDLAALAAQPPLADVKTLALGFQELAVKASAPPPPPPAPAPAPAPPPAPPVNKVYGPDDSHVTPPATVRQALPSFPGPVVPEGQGNLELVIDESGAVVSAVMRTSVHPMYDNLAVRAAKSWKYKPALADGLPVKYRKVVQIVLKPSR